MSYAGVDYDDSWYLSKCRKENARLRDEVARLTAECEEQGVDRLALERERDRAQERLEVAKTIYDSAEAEVERLTAAVERVTALCDEVERVGRKPDWSVSTTRLRAALAAESSP